jgi:catechol 2,3-dioxygenase-like lactoylglutathione lyase family enzyme
MTHRGFSHIGLSTLDLDKTREFYEGVLGLKPVVADTITIEEGGRLRHLFFDVGGDQLVAFLEPQDVPGVPTDYDAGINRRLPWRRSATNSAPRASRSPISSTTNGPSRSTSKIRTACRSNIAA